MFITFISCTSSVQDTFNSKELVSSKGEKIYINSLNWGVTDDNQLTIISSNRERLKDRKDDANAAKGLEPFIFRFKNDSLHLYFLNERTYTINEKFKSINVSYVILGYKDYNRIRAKAYENDEYSAVPDRIKKSSAGLPPAPNK